ncbi:hypothetical protein FJZ22_02690 [Candidatus Pacearchaeota archaeon]|nr:hypothetical protein [Candidatus Pacearchaeota archaeon]
MAEQQMKKRDMRAFYDVKAPMTGTKIQLYGQSPEALVGKVIKLDLTRSLRGKGAELHLRTSLVDGELVAHPIAFEVFGSYIRRSMRNNVSYIEDSFVVQTKDASVIIKPFLLTRRKVSRALKNALRVAAKEYLTSLCTIRTSQDLFTDLISNKVQKEMSLKLKKLYPLALCEVRVFKLIEKPVTGN